MERRQHGRTASSRRKGRGCFKNDFHFSLSRPDGGRTRNEGAADGKEKPLTKLQTAPTAASPFAYLSTKEGTKQTKFLFSERQMPKIRPYHVDMAIAAAATLVMESMTRAANHHAASARSLATAILPAFGISWNRNVINAVTREWTNLLLKLRNSPLPGFIMT